MNGEHTLTEARAGRPAVNCDGGFGVESCKVLLDLSQEFHQDHRGGGDTYLWPGEVVEMPDLSLPPSLWERERDTITGRERGVRGSTWVSTRSRSR